MKPKSIKPDELSKIFAELKKGDESAIGSYLVKGVRLQISKYNLSGAERVQLLYKRRRAQGMCIVCGKKVTKKNPSTDQLYRLCEEHRNKIDKGSK
ncbi:profilin domain protein [Leptospira bourretii]|uniref:Profilin domain protein n=3 Tax=Leptospira TaxID=171 RepID=A0A4R9INV6_9LEPT|nr:MULTISPECIES: profilin domain protein [Leptospira]PKA25222.1 profilin domain protein [Leptospira sp. mixed culture ATI2-C-A1]EKJ86231.1 profilin domain protein [Leptospira meyeri serovar Hardjo str. Went 5]MCG6140276.1 profilin domain protein [Leptospira mtsangambouensis]MCW7488135.1 profilin domain protein [Leptospira meyeri]PJZ81567.1 profilin domain protein [Leptospira meyeri]